MDDLYSVLLGEAPNTADKVAATAAALRRRQTYGELGALSGDKFLTPLGQRMTSQADQYAEQLQNTRQKDIDNEQTQRYQTGQLQHMDSVLKETMRGNDMRDATTRRGQDMALQAALARAAATSGKGNKLTVSDRRDLTQGAGLVGNMQQLLTTFKDDYAAPQVMGKSVPGVRPLTNALSAAGLGTKAMDEAQGWWAASDRLYTLFQRNKLFGATLTSNEMKAWAQANANRNMKPTQIREMLGSIMDLAKQELDANVEGFKEGGYNSNQVDSLTQRARTEYVTPNKQIEVDPEEDFGDLSPDEIQELLQLRGEYGGGR